MKTKIYVFDFDGTLTTCDTLLRFIPFACGRWAFWRGMLLHAPLLVLMKLGLYDNGRAKECVFRYFFRGMKESMFNNLCELFADVYADILRPEGVKTIRQALADGHEVVVVSASIDRWVRPFFKSNLAPSHPRTPAPSIIIIGTQIETRDGFLTGRFATPNCYGEEKVRRLRQLFPELAFGGISHSSLLAPRSSKNPRPLVIAYGDSRGDRELLQLADEAHYKPFRKKKKHIFLRFFLLLSTLLCIFVAQSIYNNKVKEKKSTILETIDSPADLRRLKVEQLPQLCSELRQMIVEETSVNPGHLASGLGVVELTVALHYVFDTPDDRIVWDVGHQAYGHKILTGRREQFCTNRKLHGIRPFPSPLESEYDTFVCGHASNSISAALGMAVAARIEGNEKRHVVAVIGDGAMSGGLAFEGLNNASSSPNDLLIILNDNNMSIDRSVGGMKQYLLNLNTNETYNRLRFRAARWLKEKGMLEEGRRQGLIRLGNAVKSALSHQQNIFEGLNIRYFGPADGHDVVEIVRLLRQLKDMRGPKLLHLHTQKGHGYKPAEDQATIWHAPGKFDPATGERIKSDDKNQPPKYQDVFGHTLLELAQQNPRIVGVTPAMPSGCSMNIMMKALPERTFDVGIAEGHAVTFSAGMAKDGLQPFCNIYSAFSQRAYDNIIHDVAMINLPVVFCFDRAGLVGEDGPTHHGAFDLAALRPVPNLIIASPMNEHELRHLMYTAQLPGKGTFVIRYPRGKGVLVDWRCPMEELPVGRGRKLTDGTDVAVLSLGPVGNNVQKAIAELNRGCMGSEVRRDENGLEDNPTPLKEPSVAHYDMRFLKPLDEEILVEVAERFDKIITIEDGVRDGGLGSAVLEWMNDHGHHPTIVRLGLPDRFVEHGTVPELQHIVGIDADGIRQAIYGILD